MGILPCCERVAETGCPSPRFPTPPSALFLPLSPSHAHSSRTFCNTRLASFCSKIAPLKTHFSMPLCCPPPFVSRSVSHSLCRSLSLSLFHSLLRVIGLHPSWDCTSYRSKTPKRMCNKTYFLSLLRPHPSLLTIPLCNPSVVYPPFLAVILFKPTHIRSVHHYAVASPAPQAEFYFPCRLGSARIADSLCRKASISWRHTASLIRGNQPVRPSGAPSNRVTSARSNEG
jgi:hypothetical protein